MEHHASHVEGRDLSTADSNIRDRSDPRSPVCSDAEKDMVCISEDEKDVVFTEKHDAEIATTGVVRQVSSSQSGGQASQTEPRTWQKSFFRLAPLAGIACLIAAICSIITALGILMGSRNAVVSSWTIPPSTYLAICTAVANQALRFAAFQGLVIAWWVRALHGDTLAQLHRTWRSGMTVGGAIAAGPNLGLVGIACLCATLVAIDGPLLQKATTIDLAPIVAPPVPLNITIAQEIPKDFTGVWQKTGENGPWSFTFNDTIPTVSGNTSNSIYSSRHMNNSNGEEWFTVDTIPGVVHGCPSMRTCNASVVAPALAVTSCVNHILPVDYWKPLKATKNVVQYTGVAPPLSVTAFLIDISLILDKNEHINLITGHGHSHNCSGSFNYTICTLDSAIGEYEVSVTNGETTLSPGQPRIIALANNTGVNHVWNDSSQGHPSTLAGIVSLAYQKYESSGQFYFSGDNVWGTGFVPTVFRHYTKLDTSSEQCFSYRDPQADVLHDLNRLMFMLGAGTANGKLVRTGFDVRSHMDPNLPMNVTTEGYIQGTANIFQTDLRWFGAAVVVELACILLILPTYFGWWRLGRAVSFSPLETAKAFEAPLLDECKSNSCGRDIAKDVGDVRVRYGEIQSGSINKTKLAFAPPSAVRMPQNNTSFDF